MNNDYVIFRDGRIWSNISNKFLKPGIGTNGYYHVIFRINGKSKQFEVHRLVATKFHSNINNLPQVNHIDGNKLNNNFNNLEWCTGEYNLKHALKNGLLKPPPKWTGKFGFDHNRSISVYEFDSNKYLVGVYGSQSEAARKNNCHISTINYAVKNKNKTRKGFYYSIHSNFE